MNKKCFTLAELLISLAVIGVIAAITVPIIFSSYRKHVIEVRLEKFYSTMNNAIRRAESDNGAMNSWDMPVTAAPSQEHYDTKLSDYEWFNRYLEPYLNVRIFNKNFHAYTLWYDGFAFGFADSSAAMCGAADSTGEKNVVYCLYFPEGKFIKDYSNIGGNTMNLMSGKDYFVFLISNGTGGRKKGMFPVSNGCNAAKKGFQWYANSGCVTLIMNNGWKFPDDYPIRI